MVREGVVLEHIVSGKGLEVDKAKIEVIQNLPLPNTVKDLRNFLRHIGFYRRFIQDFAKVSMPLTTLLWQRQGLHHQRRREVRIQDIEANTDRGTDSTKS